MAILRKKPDSIINIMDYRHSQKNRQPARLIAGVRTIIPNNKKTKAHTQTKITDVIKKKDGGTPMIHKKLDLDKVKFKQLNSNKREVSMDELNRYCSSQKYFICLGHEPNNRLGAPTGLNKRHIKIHKHKHKK